MADYLRNGQDPGPLPARATDATGTVWSDLANNAAGREACGFTLAPSKPSFDPESVRVEWDGDSWAVVSITPAKVSGLQLELELHSRNMLSGIQTAIAAGPVELQIYWRRTSEFHINHPELLEFVDNTQGLSRELLADIFTAAKSRL